MLFGFHRKREEMQTCPPGILQIHGFEVSTAQKTPGGNCGQEQDLGGSEDHHCLIRADQSYPPVLIQQFFISIYK